MESFGLFDLLKTLLPKTENSAQPPEENSEKIPSHPPENNTPKWLDAPSQNAFLEFVSRHDERKRNIKK